MNLAACNHVESLSRRGMLALQAPAGTRIRTQTGTVWVTQDGQPDDWVLNAGESAQFDHDGSLLVFAFDPSLICIDTPRDAGPLRPAVLKRIDPSSRAPRRPDAHPVRAQVARWLNALVGA